MMRGGVLLISDENHSVFRLYEILIAARTLLRRLYYGR